MTEQDLPVVCSIPKYDPSTESTKMMDEDIGTYSEDSLVIIDKQSVANTQTGATDHTPSPSAFVIGDDEHSPSPQTAMPSPSRQQEPTTAANAQAGDENDFLAMLEPSHEAIANAKITILRANLKPHEERLEAAKQELLALGKQHDEQRNVDRDEHNKDLEGQRLVYETRISALQQSHLAGLDAVNQQLDVMKKGHNAHEGECHAGVEMLRQQHEVEINALKQKHADDLKGVQQEQHVKIEDLTQAHKSAIEKLEQLRRSEHKLFREENQAEIEAYKNQLEKAHQHVERYRGERDRARMNSRSHANVPLQPQTTSSMLAPAAPPTTKTTSNTGTSRALYETLHDEHKRTHRYPIDYPHCQYCATDLVRLGPRN